METWDLYWLKMAYLVAERSKDPRTKIGTVLVKDNNIVSSGYNNFPRKVLDLQERYEHRETKYKFICHSEENAVLNAARIGASTMNSICYTMAFPCSECTKMLIQAGVEEIVLHSKYPTLSGVWSESRLLSNMMLREAEIPIRLVNDVLNVKGLCDGKEINL